MCELLVSAGEYRCLGFFPLNIIILIQLFCIWKTKLHHIPTGQHHNFFYSLNPSPWTYHFHWFRDARGLIFAMFGNKVWFYQSSSGLDGNAILIILTSRASCVRGVFVNWYTLDDSDLHNRISESRVHTWGVDLTACYKTITKTSLFYFYKSKKKIIFTEARTYVTLFDFSFEDSNVKFNSLSFIGETPGC